MTLEEACILFQQHCLLERKLSPSTVRAYKSDLACFVRAVNTNDGVAAFSEQWIERAFQLWCRDATLKAITVKRRMACVKVFVRWLFRRRQISFNPLERVHIEIKLPRRLPRNLHTDEICALVGQAPAFCQGGAAGTALGRRQWDQLTARLAIEVLTLTGIRVGELVRVRKQQLNIELGQIRILGKGNKERNVSFPDQITVERLQQYRASAPTSLGISDDFDSLLVNGLGRPANEQYIRRIVREYAEDADLSRRITPHMLRHTAATQLLEAGLDIRFVQRLLGHASITTTEIYTHVADHVLRAEITRADVRRRLEMHR